VKQHDIAINNNHKIDNNQSSHSKSRESAPQKIADPPILNSLKGLSLSPEKNIEVFTSVDKWKSVSSQFNARTGLDIWNSGTQTTNQQWKPFANPQKTCNSKFGTISSPNRFETPKSLFGMPSKPSKFGLQQNLMTADSKNVYAPPSRPALPSTSEIAFRPSELYAKQFETGLEQLFETKIKLNDNQNWSQKLWSWINPKK
jgi:hypothetical protein